MSAFVFFVFGAVIFGIGAMLAPALPTEEAHIGLASIIALGIVLAGGIAYMRLFEWDTLVIDYLVFGLVSTVVLGGTMVQAHQQAQSGVIREQTMRLDAVDRVLLAGLGVACFFISILPAMQTHQTDPTIALAIQSGQALVDLPRDFGSTGYHVLVAYLGQQLRQDITLVQIGVSSAAVFLSGVIGYDMGRTLSRRQLARGSALAGFLLACVMIWLGNAHLLLTVLFVLAAALFIMRLVRYRLWTDGLGLLFIGGVLLLTV